VDSLDEVDITAPALGRMSLPRWEYIPGEVKENSKINPKEFNYCVGWCLLTKKKVFDKIGDMPTNFQKGFFEDLLWGYRANKAGFKIKITEGTGVKHLYHTTFLSEGYNLSAEYQEKRKIFLKLLEEER